MLFSFFKVKNDNKNNLKKFLSVVLGFILCFFLLEGSIRVFDLGKNLYMNFKHYQKTKQRKGPLILCLGDSMTDNSYPDVLKNSINKKLKTLQNFTVINGGVSGTNADYIVKNLNSLLDKYMPDIVVIMTGNNQSFPFIKEDNNDYSLLFKYIKSAKFVFFVY